MAILTLPAVLPEVPTLLSGELQVVDRTAHCDSIAKHIIDAVGLLGSTSAIQAGQTTTLNRIATLNDSTLTFPLLDGFEAAMAAETAWFTRQAAYNPVLDDWAGACAALDQATGGLSAYLAANGVQVDPHFLDAFNRAVSRGNLHPLVTLKPYQSFGPVVANMGQFNATGGTGGSFAAGSTVPATYGNAPLSVFNAGNSNIGVNSVSVTVTFNTYDSGGNLLTGRTANVTMPGGTVPGGSVSLGVSGVAVTGITVVNGNNGDKIAVQSALLRAVVY